jgi:lipopolysaccharide export system permease protein
MAKLNNLLFSYLAKEFAVKFLIFFIIFMGIVFLFDTIELMRRADSDDQIPLGILLQLGLYKLPEVGQQILPFIVLFAGIATFRSLSDRQELVCIRSAGLSVWQFIIPILSTTLVFSLFYLTILNPLSAMAMKHYNDLDNKYFGSGVETITQIDDGLWLRQEDETGNFILKAGTLDAKKWIMNDVNVFFFDETNTHIQRIDAKSAQLKPSEWVFKTVSVHRVGQAPSILPTLSLTTTLTAETITESFSDPQTISFWQLPYFISSLETTGLDTTDMQAYYHGLLSQPLLLIAMIFVAAAITLKTQRGSTILPIIIMGLGLGFIIFFMIGFLRALALGQEVPIILAVWSVPFIILLCATTWLAQREDG